MRKRHHINLHLLASFIGLIRDPSSIRRKLTETTRLGEREGLTLACHREHPDSVLPRFTCDSLVQNEFSVRGPTCGGLVCPIGVHQFFNAGTIGGLAIQIVMPGSVGGEKNGTPIRRPDRIPIIARAKCKPCPPALEG